MRRSGKLSVRACARASLCPWVRIRSLVWDVATYERTPMRARPCVCLRLRVLVCRRLGSWDQRALLGPSSEDTLRSTPARPLHALPLLLVKLLPLDPCPLPSAPLRAFTPLVSVRTGVALWQGGAVALHVAALFSEARIHPR
jgi:hypothetical protein